MGVGEGVVVVGTIGELVRDSFAAIADGVGAVEFILVSLLDNVTAITAAFEGDNGDVLSCSAIIVDADPDPDPDPDAVDVIVIGFCCEDVDEF
eukprot:Pgem_evm3s17913